CDALLLHAIDMLSSETSPHPELSTLSLHDALPILPASPAPAATSAERRSTAYAGGLRRRHARRPGLRGASSGNAGAAETCRMPRSEEHTSELQSRENLVCRLLRAQKNDPARRAKRI